MNLSAWSIHHPLPTLMLFVLLSLFGIHGLRTMQVQNYPDVDLPTLTVTVPAPGMSAARMEVDVVRPLENVLVSVSGVRHLGATVRDGAAVVSVELDLDTPIQAALEAVRETVAAARSSLPPGVGEPTIARLRLSSAPIMAYAVHAPQRDEAALTALVVQSLMPALQAVRGVGMVNRIGGREKVVRIELDASRLAALRLDAAAVTRQIEELVQPAFGGRTAPGAAEQVLAVRTRIDSTEQLTGVRIALAEGRHIRLGDIASVREDLGAATALARLGDAPVIALEISRVRGVGELEVAAGVREALARWQAQHADVQVTLAFDRVTAVQENFEGSLYLLLEGAVLAVLVVGVALRDVRATLIVATALPLSILPAFAAMQFAGFSLNVVTLLALSLVVGVLVDDAIVEIENIARHLAMGKSPRQAALDASDEIGLAVVATTLTLVAVFLPTAFMGGVAGRFFVQFGWTASIAVLASLLVARMLTPLLAAEFLKPQRPSVARSPLLRNYLGWVRAVFARRWLTVCLATLLCLGGMSLAASLDTSFMPPDDGTQTQVRLEMPPGATLQETAAMSEAVRVRLQSHPLVRQVYSSIGAGGAGSDEFDVQSAPDTRRATLTILVAPRSQRAGVKLQAVEAQLRLRLRDLGGVRLDVGLPGSADRYVLMLLSDDEPALLTQAQQITEELQGLPGLGAVTSTAQLYQPTIDFVLHQDRAAAWGVTVPMVAASLRAATVGDSGSSKSLWIGQGVARRPVVVGFPEHQRNDLDALALSWVGGGGLPARIGEVAQLSWTERPVMTERFDRQRSVRIEIDPGLSTLGDVAAAVAALPSLQLMPASVRVLAVGDSVAMDELFDGFALAMGTGLLCVLAVLLLLFKDAVQPFTVLVALALSVPGAFVALYLAKQPLSMPTLIGLIMLMGITTKNAILLVEYALVARRHRRMGRREALLDACRKRARPIVMTTVAMAAGMLPIALGVGVDPGFRAPMAVVVLGGLLTSTLFSLIVVPVVFIVLDDLARSLRVHRA